MKRLALLLAIVVVVGYAAWRLDLLKWPPFQRQETAQGGGGRRGPRGADGPVAITAADIVVKDVPVTLDAIGTVQALNTVTVRTQVDGRLLKLSFTEGQDVKAGDVLARIDPALYQAQYDQAVAKKAQDEATLANARIDLDRYVKLAQGNAGSKQQADTQKALVAQLGAQVQGDQASIDNTKATLDFATIRSPLDGRIGIRLVDEGNILHASDETGIVVITQLKPIAVIFTLAQQFLRRITDAQQQGHVRTQALASDNAAVIDTGEVTVIDNQVDPTTGTVKIKAVFPNPQLHLWPGQFVNTRMFTGTIPQAQVVPTAAVQRGPNGAYVYVLDEQSIVHQTNVTVGQQNEREAVILSGVKAPAKVVTTGFARLTDGAAVRVVPAAAATASDDGAGEGAADTLNTPATGAPDTDRPRRRGSGEGRRTRGQSQ
jgi:multidrug efflux system membrane fusion protein